MVGSRELGEDDWRRQKSAGLVKLLALAPGRRLHRERVAELLWPGCSPERSLNNLHRELHAARKVLQPRDPASELCLCLRNRWLDLYPYGTVWVDVSAFEEAVANARRMNTPAAYETALSLYAGELLPYRGAGAGPETLAGAGGPLRLRNDGRGRFRDDVAPGATSAGSEVAAGAALGVLAWGAGWAGWLWMLGVHGAPWEQRSARVLLPVIDHAFYGAVWGLLYRVWRRDKP